VIEEIDAVDLVDHLGQELLGIAAPHLEAVPVGVGDDPA
jgi:hypothetical protein